MRLIDQIKAKLNIGGGSGGGAVTIKLVNEQGRSVSITSYTSSGEVHETKKVDRSTTIEVPAGGTLNLDPVAAPSRMAV